jgi:hypothetical protein
VGQHPLFSDPKMHYSLSGTVAAPADVVSTEIRKNYKQEQMMRKQLTDAHIEELDHEGFIIVPDFITGDELKTLQAAQRRVLPTWKKIKEEPPQDQAGTSLLVCFPYEEMELYQAAMDEQSITFARKWLKTEAIHMRVGCLIARYPGHSSGGTGFDDSNLHIDNGNNSLLPMNAN